MQAWVVTVSACLSPCLPTAVPSFLLETPQRRVEENHCGGFGSVLQLTRLPSTPADCGSLTPNSTQHPGGAAACLAGCPRCRSQFLPCDTEGKRGYLGTENPGLNTGREKFDVKLGCKWEKHKKTRFRDKNTIGHLQKAIINKLLEKPWVMQAGLATTQWGRVALRGYAQCLEPGLRTPPYTGEQAPVSSELGGPPSFPLLLNIST